MTPIYLKSRKRLCCIQVGILLVFALNMPRSVEGALGKSEKAIKCDLASLGLQKLKKRSEKQYRYYELTSKDLTVKEFVDVKRKVVFAVTWKGNRPPDQIALLGFDPATIQGVGYRSLHHSRIQQNNLVYEVGGHLNFYVGRVVRTDLIPATATLAEIVP